MFSVVLMTAVTAGSAAPDNWFSHRGHGHGYNGGCYCNGCFGCNGCNGCNGYGYMAVHGNFCSGCWGGCGCSGWGWSGHGGYGPGGLGYSGCYGCTGCYGGYSSLYGGPPYWAPMGCYGCYGAYAGWACYGAPLPHHGVIDLGPVGGSKKEPKTEETPMPKEKKLPKDEEVRLDRRARVIVELPEDAKLYIDGNLMTTTSAKRTFQTPDLIAGQTYFYELKAEVIREGRTVAETQRVLLRPGQVVNASFGRMDTATASREE